MKIIYVGGAFTAPNAWEIHRNVCRAEALGFAVAQAGAMPLIPHMNTKNFHGTLPASFWYEGTLELLRRCDAMILVPGWQDSEGTKAEVEDAKMRGQPVFEKVGELKAWMERHTQPANPLFVRARAFDEIVQAGKQLSEGGEAFVDAIDDIVQATRIELGEIPDPTKGQ